MRALLAILLTANLAFGCETFTPFWTPPPKRAGTDELFPFIGGGAFGFIDRSGRVVIQPRVSKSGWFQDGVLSLRNPLGLLLDRSGRAVHQEFFDIGRFDEGLAPAQESRDTKPRFIDRTGRSVIQFPNASNVRLSDFSEGLAAVELDEKLGYIDPAGTFVIPRQFAGGTGFRNGSARVVTSGPCLTFENAVQVVCASPDIFPRTGPQQSTIEKCKWSYIDKAGRRLFAAEFDAALPFEEGLAAVRVGELWGFINETGSFVISPRYLIAESFSEGLAWVLVKVNGKSFDAGYIERTGTIRIIPTDGLGSSFSDGRAVVSNHSGAHYYIGRDGKQAIPGTFSEAGPFFHGLAHVRLKGEPGGPGLFAYIDPSGKRVFVYRSLHPRRHLF